MDPASLDEAKELLYGLPLESFIAERDLLVKQIRVAGNRDLANEVKTLRKPSTVAAEVNHIVRADPAGTDLILQAAALLRAAQTGALEGSTIDASELQQQYRAAIQGLSQSAPSRRAEVRAALEAATIDEASHDDLRSGCLVVVPTPVSLFGTAPPSPTTAGALAAVDELEAQRVRRRASNVQGQPLGDEQAATAAQAAERAAAEKRRAAEAQHKRAEKERQRKLTALKKEHSDAVRAHLAALDAQEAAAAEAQHADRAAADAADEHEALEDALAAVQVRRAAAEESRSKAERAKADAIEHSEQAEAKAEALAQVIAALRIG